MPKTGDIIETRVNRFDGGVSNDPRNTAENTCRMVTGFDVFSNPHKMTPYRQSENGDTSSSTSRKQKFDIGFWVPSGGSWRLFALGVVSGQIYGEVLSKQLSTGGTEDLGDGVWLSPAANQSASGVPNFNLFKYYHKTGKFYGARNGTHIFTFTPDGSTAWNDTEFAASYTNAAQALVHSKDDILYVPLDNKIYKNDAGTWSLALTLPSHFYITSVCEYGNNIGIAISPLAGNIVDPSRVYIWDRDTSITTLSETIPWEYGRISILEVVDGYLIGISLSGDSVTRFDNKIVFRYLSGSAVEGYRAELLFSIQSGTAGTTSLPFTKQIIEGRLHFMMSVYVNGVTRDGVWSLGKVGERFALVHERTPNNDTALTSGVLYDFIYVGDYLFQAYQSSSAWAVSKTDNANDFTTPAIYESNIFSAGDNTLKKDLMGITISTEPLYDTSSPVVRLFYRIVNTSKRITGWIRIFSKSVTSGTDTYYEEQSISATNIEIGANGAADTVTMTIASPAVVTLTNHDLVARQTFKFATTGALPTGVTAGTTYYVLSTSLAANTFRFSTSEEGSAVNTSGSQSGTHTIDRSGPLPKDYNEIEFRLEAESGTSGLNPAEIVEISFKERITGKRVYN